MNRYFDSWAPAAKQLGVELRGPLSVPLPTGESLKARLHVPEFGAQNGMLIFDHPPTSRASNALIELGFGYSVFGEPPAREITTQEDLAEVLRDWGWSGPAAKAPNWL
jgi:hypothetical protein